MMRMVGLLRGLEVIGEDGAIGSLEDAYFDHEEWRLRHVVVFTGAWLSGRWIVLPAPMLGEIDSSRRTVPVAASRERIGSAPAPETDKPIGRTFERALYAHYGCEPYWKAAANAAVEAGRSHLLSADELQGYRVEALDGEVGRLEDYLVEPRDWGIRYLCVAARRWLIGRHMVVPSDGIRLVSWRHKRVLLRRFRDEIRNAPAFTGPGSLTPDYSRALETYYSAGGADPWKQPYC